MASAEALTRDQGVTLSIASAAAVDREGFLPVCVSIRPVVGADRTPLDICCVVDISWSMSMEATIQGGSGVDTESDGLSLMDVAKHAVRTVIQTLGPNDRLSLVTFAKDSQVILSLTSMDAAGKAKADAAVKDIGFDSDTFLWTGLSKGLETLQVSSEGRLSHLLVLTDGEAKDKGAIMGHLHDWKSKHEKLPGSIHTFGIGYEIDSLLLSEIAAFADGTFAFIPDAGFVGTIFVNTISNIMVTMGKDAVLTLESDGSAKIVDVLGNWSSQASSGIVRLYLGNLQYDQSKDIILKMSAPSGAEDALANLAASLEYSMRHVAGDRVRCQAEGNSSCLRDAAATAAVEQQRCRALFVDALASASAEAMKGDTNRAAAAQAIKAAADQLKASSQASSTSVTLLIQDAEGQSSEALSRADWHKKWGRHYLPSIMFAHKMQLCNNFKDPGVQDYGGNLFRQLRDQADDAFCTLSAPSITPAMWRYLGDGKVIANPTYVNPNRPSQTATSGYRAPAPAAPVDMARYHDACGG